MKFYRYKILIEDGTNEKELTHGIVIGKSLGDAADRVANSFSNNVDYEVTYVKVELIAPDDDVLILNKNLIDKIAKEVIW